MPFGVSKWPASGDPRWVSNLSVGFQYGACAPYKFFMQSVGANGVFAQLAAGVMIEQTYADFEQGQYENPVRLPWELWCSAAPFGYDPPVVFPPGANVNWLMSVVTREGAIAAESLWLTSPNPIQVFTFDSFVIFGADASTIPNAITITPRKWDA